jgi:signal transduction histidine kinase
VSSSDRASARLVPGRSTDHPSRVRRRVVAVPTAFEPGTDRASALRAIRDDLGFETARLFVPTPAGWELLEREGPVQSWHAVLDPAALEGTPDAAEYADARTIPGMGPRLARLGCASVASLPFPGGARLILDAATPAPLGGWIERATPYIELIGLLHGPLWSGAGALRDQAEREALGAVFAACRAVLGRTGSDIELLLDEVRDAVGAAELVLLAERGTELQVFATGPSDRPRRIPRYSLSELDGATGPASDPDALAHLAIVLGMTSRSLAAAPGRPDDGELVVAGWNDVPRLSPVSMSVVAQAVCTARAALRWREQTVGTVLDRERTRLAYALHDGLTQTVAGAVLELEALHKRVERDPEEALETLDRSKREIRRALAGLRSMLFDLSRHDEDEKLVGPLRAYAEDVVQRWKLPATISVEGDLARVPPRVLSVAYVVVREALANAAKHAAASHVSVRILATERDLSVVVGDGGNGFTTRDEQAARAAHHIGLEMLRRRVREVGGRLRIESRPGFGTKVTAHLPLEEGPAAARQRGAG